MTSRPTLSAGAAGPATSSATPPTAANPRVGYAFAALNMLVSGVAIYVNSIGVRMFSDSTLYTFLKNGVVGIALLVPILINSTNRAEYRRLKARQWGLLILVSLMGGSVAYALFFQGLQSTTPVTASLIGHTQFLVVGLLAALFLKERFGGTVWTALVVLLVGLTVGLKLSAVRWDAGVPLLIAATLLFAADFVVMKYLLRSVSVLTVMAFKMTLGVVLLGIFVAASGHLRLIGHLSPLQWGFVLVTGLILLAFTTTSILGLRNASATAVTAIPAAAPIVTTVLVVISRHSPITPVKWLGLALMLLAVLVVFLVGRRQEVRSANASHSG